MTDQELAARARDGDQDAFEQLVRDNEKRIYTLALRMTGSREDALDLAQDAFFQAWKALPTFQGESSFATWLYRLATNLCLDHLRTQKRRTQSMGPPSPWTTRKTVPSRWRTSSSSPRRRWSAQSAAGPWSGGWPPSRITTARC